MKFTLALVAVVLANHEQKERWNNDNKTRMDRKVDRHEKMGERMDEKGMYKAWGNMTDLNVTTAMLQYDQYNFYKISNESRVHFNNKQKTGAIVDR